MEREQWWWNGKWGRIARLDVMIWRDEGGLFVETQEGGAEGRRNRYRAADDAAAKGLAEEFMNTPGRWRPMM